VRTTDGHREDTLALILDEIVAEHRAWVRLVGGLPPEQVTRKLEDGWSAVDYLVHVTAWQENAVVVARRLADPAVPDPGPTRGAAGILGIDVDRFNAETLASHRGWGFDRALAWSEEINSDLRRALAALQADRLVGGRYRHGARRWYWRPGVVHSREHRGRLRRLLVGRDDPA
jgi:hypothetical protein